jgi:hypothetical protein
MDVCLTIFKDYSSFPDKLNSCYAITIHHDQLSVNFNGGNGVPPMKTELHLKLLWVTKLTMSLPMQSTLTPAQM